MALKFPAVLRVVGRSIVDWWDSWLDMVMVTIVWFLAQVTIILGPPATFGYYYVAYNLVNGESLGIRGLIEGARRYFWKAWLWGIINLLVLLMLVINIQFYSNLQASWGLSLLILVLLLGLVWYCTQFYALPFFMEQEDKRLRVALKNGLFTTLAAPIFSLVLVILSAVFLGLSIGIVLPLFLGIPALVPVMGFRGMYDRLIKFGIRQPEKTPKEIETEQISRVYVPEFRQTHGNAEPAPDSSAADEDAAASKGQE